MTQPPLRPRAADRAARAWWDEQAEAYQAEHGAFLSGFVWGPEGRTEAELAVLGPASELPGLRVLELGAGAAQCSAWLADRGSTAVALDISLHQLRHGLGTRAEAGPDRAASAGSLTLVAGSASALPFSDHTFDIVFSAYGAVQFVADLDLLLTEAVRVLRPGGRFACSVTHPLRWAFPDDPTGAGLAVSGSYFDRDPYVERGEDGVVEYAEFHRTLADYVAALARAGLTLDTLLEPEWPDWNDGTWGGWSPLRGANIPGTLILGARLPSTAGA